MKIKVTYPEDLVLSSWDKSITDLAIKKVFSRDIFWDFDLAKLRAKLKKDFATARAAQTFCEATSKDLFKDDDEAHIKDLAYELDLLSAVSFSEMNPDTLQLLPSKLSEYLGVKIEWAKPTRFLAPMVSFRPRLAYLLLFGFVAVAVVGLILITTSRHRSLSSNSTYNLGTPVPSRHIVQNAFIPSSLPSNAEVGVNTEVQGLAPDFPVKVANIERSAPNTMCDGDETLCLNAQTSNPNEFVKKMAASLPLLSAGNYSVVLHVMPLFDHQEGVAKKYKP